MPFPIFWTRKQLLKLQSLYNSGLSMKEVGVHFNKSVWSINNIMQRHHISRRPASITRQIQFRKSPLSFFLKRQLSLKEQKLKIAGLMLYWGEGAKKKTNRQVNLANADPTLILLFIKFLRSIYQVDESKLRCHLYCFNNQNIHQEINYWSKLTHIPSGQFIRPYLATNKNPSHDKIPHGVCHIVYSDKRLFELILSDIHKLSNNLII